MTVDYGKVKEYGLGAGQVVRPYLYEERCRRDGDAKRIENERMAMGIVFVTLTIHQDSGAVGYG